jgi:hypothetical protein
MDVIGFLCVSLGSSTVQLHDSLGRKALAYIQKLVSVVKMAAVLEEYMTEEQRSDVRFFVSKRIQYKGYPQRYVSCLQWEAFVA